MELPDHVKIENIVADLNIEGPEGTIRIKDKDKSRLEVSISDKKLFRNIIRQLPGSIIQKNQQLKKLQQTSTNINLGIEVTVDKETWIEVKPNKPVSIKMWKLIWQQILTWLGL